MASTYGMDTYEDFYISRVELQDNKYLNIYGWHKDGLAEEFELDGFAHGQLEYIIDQIPETEAVQDVTIVDPES